MPANGSATAARAAWLDRLEAAGWRLPSPPSPLEAYDPAAEVGGLLFLSGMLPIDEGRLLYAGRTGAEVSFEQGRSAVARAALNGLAVAAAAVGDPSRVRGVVRLGVNVAATEDFTRHPALADAASELLNTAFPSRPRHTRLVAGARSLANGSPVVLEMIFSVDDA